MNVIHEEIKAAEQKELAAAIEKHGLHHSYHEKFSVMLEEYEEAQEEIDLAFGFMKMMWDAGIRHDNFKLAQEHASRVECAALRLAEEAVQLAAMARKAVENHV